jgi:hypothetical protein
MISDDSRQQINAMEKKLDEMMAHLMGSGRSRKQLPSRSKSTTKDHE